MQDTDIAAAAALLAEARRSGVLIETLPGPMQPANVEEAHAVQDRLVSMIGEPVAGWKVAGTTPPEAMRGAIVGSRLLPSLARIEASLMPMRGIEAEIAFRFERDFPDRAEPYSYEEVAEAVLALPVIEIVDTHFTDYAGTPALHRLCDLMSNGGLVCGEPVRSWRALDLTDIPVRLETASSVLVERRGGHVNGDPLLPAVALVNALRTSHPLKAGQVITTGSYTGLVSVAPGETVRAVFEGLGTAELTFTE